MYSQFIIKKPIGFSLILACLLVDFSIIGSWFNNSDDFDNKPEYVMEKRYDDDDLTDVNATKPNITVHRADSDLNCTPINKSDLCFFGIFIGDEDIEIEIQNRVDVINELNHSFFTIMQSGLTIFHFVTSVCPLILDLILSICDHWFIKIRDTQKISLMRNTLVVNWVLMEPLTLLLTSINSISYDACFQPKDSSFLYANYQEINFLLFFTITIIELYIILWLLVKYRNEFPCQLLTFLAFNFTIFHTIIIYNTAIGSKKTTYVLFTYRQWVSLFEIQKLFHEFYYVQDKFRKLRIQEAKFAQLKNIQY